MNLKLKIVISIGIILLSGIFVYFTFKNTESYNISYYKNVWKKIFLNYQTQTANIPKKGVFDIEFFTIVNDNKNLLKFANLNFSNKFTSFGINLDGDYDFSGKEKLFTANIRIYLNKKTIGKGDFDITIYFESGGKIAYVLNNTDKEILEFIGLNNEYISDLNLLKNLSDGNKTYFEKKALDSDLIGNLLEIFNTEFLNPPIYKNSKDEEKQIITSFLENEVIRIDSGSKQDDYDLLEFSLNKKGLINFINSTAQILGEKKDFSQDSDILKNISIKGKIKTKSLLISDSNIISRFGFTVNDGSVNKNDILNIGSKIHIGDPKKLDFDITNLIYSESSPDNKVQLRFKTLIK